MALLNLSNITTIRKYHTSFSLWPPLLSTRDAELLSCEQRNSKRERISNTDVELSLRKGQDPVNMAIDHLGELYLSMRHLEKDRGAQRLVRWIRVLLSAFTNEIDKSRLGRIYEELESLQDGLQLVNRVSVNSVSNSRRTMLAHLLGIKRQRSVINLGTWKIELDTVCRDSIDTIGRDVNKSLSSLRLKSTKSPGLGQQYLAEGPKYTVRGTHQRTTAHFAAWSPRRRATSRLKLLASRKAFHGHKKKGKQTRI
jgi:hypothetical protein